MARPPKLLDLGLVEDLAKILCTDAEIAAMLHMTAEGFRKRKLRDKQLVGVLEKGRETGRQSLRRLQWKSALKGNVAMQIWLGKQHLGQKEPKQMLQHSGEEEEPVQIVVVHTPVAERATQDSVAPYR